MTHRLWRAMAADVSDRLWPMEDNADRIGTAGPQPLTRGAYRKRAVVIAERRKLGRSGLRLSVDSIAAGPPIRAWRRSPAAVTTSAYQVDDTR